MTFLTDGRLWLGPYHPDEPGSVARGVRWLREVEQARDVWAVEAADERAARSRFSRSVRRKL